MILHHFIFPHFSNVTHGGIEKSKYQENIPEINDSERDLIPVKFLQKSVEQQKSLRFLRSVKKNLDFFFHTRYTRATVL